MKETFRTHVFNDNPESSRAFPMLREKVRYQVERNIYKPSGNIVGAVSRKPRKLFGPVKPLQNLEPCDYRAVLFTYSKDEGRFPSYKKFQAYTLLRF